MKRIGSLDIAKNLKLRGVAVDDFTTQGGFYSQQFGEVAYKSDLSGLGGGSGTGFYGVTVKHSDNSDSFKGINLIAFNSVDFYVTQNSPNTDEVVVSLRNSGASYVHTQASSSTEWAITHNLNNKNLMVQAFDSRDREIEYDTVDTSNPNVAYFYFIPAASGKAILASGIGVSSSSSGGAIDVSDGIETFTDTDSITFNGDHFYLSKTNAGKPMVNLVAGYVYVEESDARAFATPGSYADFIEMSRIPMPGPCDSKTRYKVSWTIPWNLSTSGYSSTDRVSQGVITTPFSIQILINNGATGTHNGLAEFVKSYPNQAFVLNPAQSGNFSGACILTPSPTQTRLGISYSYSGFYSLALQSLSTIGTVSGVNTANLLIERLPS